MSPSDSPAAIRERLASLEQWRGHVDEEIRDLATDVRSLVSALDRLRGVMLAVGLAWPAIALVTTVAARYLLR